MITRRAVLTASGWSLLAAPFAAVQALARPPAPPQLRQVRPGEVFTAATWNELVGRVNELSRHHFGGR